jgi:cytochrome c2
MARRLYIAVISVAIASGVTLAAQDAKQVEEGKKVYEVYNCNKCHRIGGTSTKLQPLDGVATKLTADEIHKWLVSPDEMTAKLKKKPVTKMKKQDFKPGEVEALMAYLSTLK